MRVRCQGRPVGAAQREFEQIFPRPGWVEHKPREILTSVLVTLTEAMHNAGVDARPGGRHRHHQPARDDRGVGPRDRGAGIQRAGLAVAALG